MNSDKDDSTVQVAVRIRPLIDSEKHRGCRNILEVHPSLHQIRIKDSDKAFTYNYVFDGATSQDTFYNTCIKHMIDNLFKGYNMTVLAYGQTGSGKTHSMGTTYSGDGEMGVIPRAVNDIFNYVNDNFAYDFTVTVSFMELYQESLYDLLAAKPREQCVMEIREDPKGFIIIPGLTEEPVKSASSTLDCLSRGSLGRATASTNMNAQSSRSHAIFTINICMQRKDDSNMNKTAKFHLVDLAGSERSKKTGATGVTFQEGVNINKGLLALGNVISALGSDKQSGYICYRDSNLTRLLKDSLGGNSITLMVACVSPADYNLDETLSTLRYADRARKIKNKPVVNQDSKAAEINRLNKLVQQLRLELVGQGGPIISQAEYDQFKRKYQELTWQLSSTLSKNAGLFEKVMLMQTAKEGVSSKLLEVKEECNIALAQKDMDACREHLNKLQDLLKEIDSESRKTDEEIRKYERSSNTTNVVSPDLCTEFEFSEHQESHTEQQIALQCELQEVNQMLAMKEHLAQQILVNTNYMVDHNAITENEAKIQALEKEKEELLQQLKNVQISGAGNKIAEQRKKRVQELEREIQELHKKIKEQSRLIKLKEKDVEKIKQLNTEIHQMKHTKVRLIKNMKQESEKFRLWKSQRERELLKLKQQDQNRLNQLVKMETKFNRQQNVVKRKVEEIAAINKRLKDALAIRKTVHDQKMSGKVERLGPWIRHELDIFVNTMDAQATLEFLLDDRAALHEQMSKIKTNPEFADAPEVTQFEEEINLRSTQIRELQQKILDSDQENKSKSRWDSIQSMGDAKFALKTLFDLTAEICRKEAVNELKLNELQNNQAEINKAVMEKENQIKSMRAEHHDLAQEYEEKIAVLLRQLRGVPNQGIEQELHERWGIQQRTLEQKEMEVQELHREIKELKAEKETFNQRLEEIKQHPMITPTIVVTNPEPKRKKTFSDLYSVVKAETKHSGQEELHSNLDEDQSEDTDWRNTPLGKRIQKLRDNSMASASLFGDRLTAKRGSDGTCACRGSCNKRSCSCMKVGKACKSPCKCSKEVCQNQSSGKENEITGDEQVSTAEDEDSSKKPSGSSVSKRQYTLYRTKQLWINDF